MFNFLRLKNGQDFCSTRAVIGVNFIVEIGTLFYPPHRPSIVVLYSAHTGTTGWED